MSPARVIPKLLGLLNLGECERNHLERESSVPYRFVYPLHTRSFGGLLTRDHAVSLIVFLRGNGGLISNDRTRMATG